MSSRRKFPAVVNPQPGVRRRWLHFGIAKGFTMLDWLNSLPDAVIVIGFAVLMGGLIVVIPLIMRSLPIVAPTPENTEFVMRIQGTLFVMSGFALAFTLAQAQANVRHVDALVAAEAAHINNLDRILTRYGEPSVAAIRPDLMTYANSVATLEWEAMHHDKEHGASRALGRTPSSRR
jgi:hypothetical protein